MEWQSLPVNFTTTAVRMMAGVIDTIYPPVCSHCRILTDRHGGLCAACWSTLRLIEKPYCTILGTPFAHDFGEGTVSPEAMAEPPVFDCLRSVALHDGIARTLVHGLKYRDRTDFAILMARWMIRASDGAVERCDAILPVPLHPRRLWSRTFNQSAELSRAIATLSGRPHFADALRRIRSTRQQVGLGVLARQDNVRGAFRVPDHARAGLAGKAVVLVDDVYTTGATVSAATRALKKAGVQEVFVLTFARAAPGLI